jgi:hypothetical protein
MHIKGNIVRPFWYISKDEYKHVVKTREN